MAACSSGKHPATPTDDQIAETPKLVPPDAFVLDGLIDGNTQTITRLLPPHVEVANRLGAPCPLDQVRAAYQLVVPRGPEVAKVTIVEGDLPDSCFPGSEHQALLRRPPFVVVGEAAIANLELFPPKVPSKWHALLQAIPAKAPVWIASEDALLQHLFGVSTVRYTLALERLELAPNLYFAGRVSATYATAGDAAIVARRIKAGEVTLPVKAPEVVESFRRMRVKQNGPIVDITFDLGMFGGIPAAELQALAATLPR